MLAWLIVMNYVLRALRDLKPWQQTTVAGINTWFDSNKISRSVRYSQDVYITWVALHNIRVGIRTALLLYTLFHDVVRTSLTVHHGALYRGQHTCLEHTPEGKCSYQSLSRPPDREKPMETLNLVTQPHMQPVLRHISSSDIASAVLRTWFAHSREVCWPLYQDYQRETLWKCLHFPSLVIKSI